MAGTTPNAASNPVAGPQNTPSTAAGGSTPSSSADLLKKGIADNLQNFLESKEGKSSLDFGKEKFMEKFLQFVERKDGALLTAFKTLCGKRDDEEISLSDLSDIRITYDDTYETYVESASRNQFSVQQAKGVAQAFLGKMSALVASKDFSDELRQLRAKYVAPHTQGVNDVNDMQRLLKIFFQHAGSSITDDQKKRLAKVSVDYHDVSDELIKAGLLAKAVADNITQKKIISLNTDAEESVKKFISAYVKTELLPAYTTSRGLVDEIAAIYKVPQFDSVLQNYDLSLSSLLLGDPAFEKVFNDPAVPEKTKRDAHQRAFVKRIAEKDAPFSKLVEQLFKHKYNLARIDRPNQQLYLDRFSAGRNNSPEMKKLDELFITMQLDPVQRKRMLTELLDLSRDSIEVKAKDGTVYTIPLKKLIVDREWAAESITDEMRHALPVMFIATAGQQLDGAYLQALTKTTDKSFTLPSEDKKPLTFFPGHYVEITDTQGKKTKWYIFQDTAGDVFLSAQPGGNPRTHIPAGQIQSAELMEPTYAIAPEYIPALLTHLPMMAETAGMSDEQIQSALQERNNDIADQSLSQNFVPEQPQTSDEQIERTDWDNPDAIAVLPLEQRAALANHTDKRLKELSTRLGQVDKQLADTEKSIASLSEQLKEVEKKQPVDQKKYNQLTSKLQKAKEKKDDLLDEKNELEKKISTYKDAQQKLDESLQMPSSAAEMQEAKEKREVQLTQVRWELSGDKTLMEPIPGKTCLMASLSDATSSLAGGGAARIRGDIISYDPSTQTLVIERHGVEGPLRDKEGFRSTVEGAEWFQQLKRRLGKVYKFKKYPSIASWGTDLKGWVSLSDDGTPEGGEHFHFDKKYESRRKHLKDDIDFPAMKNQKTGKDIKYFGKKSGDQRARFEIEQSGGSVKVRQISLDKDTKDPTKAHITYEKVMPVNDFMIFAMEKDLRGYTQEEVDAANYTDKDWSRAGAPYIADRVDFSTQSQSRFGRWAFNLKWWSIAGILSFWETAKKGIKTHFDEKAAKTKSKTENALLGASRFKAMEKIPVLGGAIEDVRIGLDNKLDNEKKKKINQHKEEIDEKKDTSSNGASDFILNALTEKEANLYPEKAAGYFLYALEKGGNPYFRTLRSKRGTGYWVKMILGDDYQKRYLAYIQSVQQDAEKNPNSGELKNALAKGELGFMQKVFNEASPDQQTHLKKLLGNWFFTWGLGAAEYGMRYNESKIDETYKNEKGKPFHQIYGDMRTGRYESFRINDVLGGLKLLSEKVGSSEEYYYKWAGAMLLPIANGQYRTDMIGSYQSIFQQLARKNAFPFAAYITDANATEKLQQLMDIFSGGSLSKAMGSATDVAGRTKAFKDRWTGNGMQALDALQSPKQLFAKKKELSQRLGDQQAVNQYNTLVDYINHKYNDEDRSNVTDEVDGESIIYQKNILSAPSGFVSAQMLSFANGQFKGKAEKHAPELRLALKGKLSDIQNISSEEMTPDFFAFLLKRYFTIFQTRYGGGAKRKFVAALKFPDLPEIFKHNVRGAFDKKFGGDDLPGEMEDALIIFEKIFERHAHLLSSQPDLLEDIFGDPRMVDYYLNATKNDVIAETNSMKQQQALLKKQLQSGIYDDLDNSRE